MLEYFYQLADFIIGHLTGEEHALCNFAAEDSDFVRFNHSAIRPSGNSDAAFHRGHTRCWATPRRRGYYPVRATFPWTAGVPAHCWIPCVPKLPYLPEDPHLLYATQVQSSEYNGANRLPEERGAIVDAVLQAGQGRDLVGLLRRRRRTRWFCQFLWPTQLVLRLYL